MFFQIFLVSCFYHILVRCPWLSPPTDSRLQVYGQYKVGSTAVYECNFGFTLFGEDRRECNESGTWVPKLPPTCHPVRKYVNDVPEPFLDYALLIGVQDCLLLWGLRGENPWWKVVLRHDTVPNLSSKDT